MGDYSLAYAGRVDGAMWSVVYLPQAVSDLSHLTPKPLINLRGQVVPDWSNPEPEPSSPPRLHPRHNQTQLT